MPPLSAQWLKYPTAGIPRNADGTPNLSAPAPKTADGKPDFAGLWRQANGVKYTVNLAADLKDGAPLLPAAATEYKRRQDTLSKDDPVGHCNLPGVPQVNAVPYPYKILQNAGQVTILYEAVRTFREIFIDGRPFPPSMNPSWIGYSVGHWDGDVLVVETRGQNDLSWIDSGGHPHTEQLVVTERFHRINLGTIELETTIDDPGAYSKPWTVRYNLTLMPDTELIEYVCTENNKDVEHLVGK
ncbi:MAG: hypothetical protein ABI824_08785 [Acidobacteriota bacterium]